MLNFTSELDDLFIGIYLEISAHLKIELLTTVLLLGVLLLVIILQARVSVWLSRTRWNNNKYIAFLIGLIFPFIYYFIVKYSSEYLNGSIAHIVFSSVAYFYLGYYIIKYLLVALKIEYVPWKLLSYILLVVASGFLMLIGLNKVSLNNIVIHEAFSLVFKLTLILLVYIFLISAVKALSVYVSEGRNFLKSIASSLLGFISVIYLIIAALWLFKIIGFASSVFVGGVVIFITIVLYVALKTFGKSQLESMVGDQFDSYASVVKSAEYFLNLLLVYILYLIFLKFYNLALFTAHLNELRLINTGVINITVFSIFSAVFIFIFLLSIVNLLKHAIYYFNIRKGNELQAGSLRSIVGNLGLLIVITVALSQLGLTWTALIPVAGALGLGIGIGLQSIMKNYISGIILLFSNRLKVGDIVELEGNAGKKIGNTLESIYGSITSIDTFSSIVSTTDGIEVVVPNSQFIDQQMVNYSLSDSIIRIRIPFGVSYGSDPNQVKEILLEIASENTQILQNPAPSLWFTEYADSAIVFYLLCWVNIRNLWRINPVISEINFKAWYRFKEAGVVIPFPQQDVWFKNNLKVEIEKDPKEGTKR